MPTRYGEPPWLHEFPRTRRPDFPRLRGEHSCGVVIVGGGLTGCATAYACAMAGLKPIVIEDGAWVSSRCIVQMGVTIGKSAVVTPNSVVHKSLEAGKIYGGNPCKYIKNRFPEDLDSSR